jgi:phage tail-like protein
MPAPPASPAGAAANAVKPADRDTTTGKRPDPVVEHRFVVVIEGVEIGFFSECSGLEIEFDVEPYEEGGQNDFVHKLRGRMKYPNLILKRGITHEDALLKWLLDCRTETARKDGHVAIQGPDGKSIRRWKFSEAFPVKWQGPTLNAASTGIATETLEIAHHGFLPDPIPAGE